jgi:hypothetical protein
MLTDAGYMRDIGSTPGSASRPCRRNEHQPHTSLYPVVRQLISDGLLRKIGKHVTMVDG